MNLLLCGAGGRMGKIVAQTAAEEGDQVACGVDVHTMSAIYPIYSDFSMVVESADVLMDFSSPEGLAERLTYAEAHRLPVVLGTTGFTEEDEERILRTAECVPLLRSGNFSLGVNLLRLLVKQAARVLGSGFDVEIIERHHSEKRDAPSGTALMLADSVREERPDVFETVYGRHGTHTKRSDCEIGVHAVRGGNIVGEHEVMFAGEDETVTLSHSARSRRVFALGALRAARFLIAQPAGLYDMDDVLRAQAGATIAPFTAP